ncbi:MAG: MATE family efflux transporter [bacterium]|nr:MATE family efflux transporter [bacterium]
MSSRGEAVHLRRGGTAGVDLLTEPILPTMLKLAGPMLMGIVAIMLFNLTDTFFVSRLGSQELAAISFTFPIVFLINGITLGLAIGMTAVLAQKIGAGRHREVLCLTRDGLLLALFIVALFTSVGLLTMDPVFRLLGADGEILQLLKSYMRIWYLGIIFIVVPMVGNGAIRSTGNTRTPAVIMTASALFNMVLDPILIFGLGPIPAMGIKGAAIATVIARASVLILALHVLVKHEKLVEFSLPRPPEMLRNWRTVLHIGAPAALNNVMVPISLGLLTRLIAEHGYQAVAAFGAGGRIQQIAIVGAIAWSSGLTPFIGQNWGAGNPERVTRVLNLSRRVLILFGIGVFIVIGLLAEPLSNLFAADPETNSGVVNFLRLALIALPFTGIIMIASSTFNAVRRPMRALYLNLSRFFLFLLPLAWLGSRLAGVVGIFLSIAAADILTSIIAWRWLRSIDMGTESESGPGVVPEEQF